MTTRFFVFVFSPNQNECRYHSHVEHINSPILNILKIEIPKAGCRFLDKGERLGETYKSLHKKLMQSS